jgi:soluble lytic murein transglycosylase-like protein
MRSAGHASALITVLVAILVAGSARADIFMYRDERGVTHFSNVPADGQYRFFMHEPKEPPSAAHPMGTRAKRARAYERIISDAATRHHVDVALVKAVIDAESAFVPEARSPKGAQGLMQLMPATATRHNVQHVFAPEDNVEGGVRHLRQLLDRYGGDVRLALAAYNAGEGAVERSQGVPPYPETLDYIARVLKFRDVYAQEPAVRDTP